jgi:hypothetical protein
VQEANQYRFHRSDGQGHASHGLDQLAGVLLAVLTDDIGQREWGGAVV